MPLAEIGLEATHLQTEFGYIELCIGSNRALAKRFYRSQISRNQSQQIKAQPSSNHGAVPN
ncbi:MAG TPA: hypothetical protein PLZ08_07320 [Bacillota bacterium]|jgi:hypothetical protein|nr:hypothetical protein [Bacillota bacterium]HOL10005.1 hypothetical protein [Bacillota bacterium]HPO97754.1 hypothetical protein [Bacillota bacterium]